MLRAKAIVVVLAVALTSCGESADSEVDSAAARVSSTTTIEGSTTPTPGKEPAPPPATTPGPPYVVAEAVGASIDVFDTPSAATPSRSLDRADEISGKVVFLLADENDGTSERVQVYLPVRPNGTTGFVDRRAVSITSHGFKLEIRLGEHRLLAYEGTDVVLDTAIGVGTADTPTPGGVFFIKELLQPPSPDGPYGTYAYGLSGFSTVLDTFNGGNGVIGVHGTNDPGTIGSDVSHGCIRVTNADIELLVEQVGLPLGTPVEILA